MSADTTSKSTNRKSTRQLPETLLVGRVRRPHGIRGTLKVEVHSEVPERFDPGSELLLRHPDGRVRRVRVHQSREISDGLLVDFEGIADRDAAEIWRKADIEVAREQAPEPPDGQYYFFELVGCRCIDARRGDLGEVVEVIEDGGGFLLEIGYQDAKLLIPFVEAFVHSVDIGKALIEVDLPPGLIEACVSRS